MNAGWALFWTAAVFAAATSAALALRRLGLADLDRRRPRWEQLQLSGVVDVLRGPSLWWCLVLGLYVANEVALEFVLVPARGHELLRQFLQGAVILSFTITLAGIVGRLIGRAAERRALGGAVTGLAGTTARVAVLVVGLLVLLSALGVHITPILAALGVGGLAVALALQDTLTNLFAGIHLLADRPIRIGDYVKVGDDAEGFVIDIGWRSTRIRSLANNVILMPNQTVARAVITNYDLPEPRVALGLKVRVDYSADPDHVEAVLLEEVTRAAEQVPGLLSKPAPSVSLIPGFGEYGLDFTVGYHVATVVGQYAVQHELRKAHPPAAAPRGLRRPRASRLTGRPPPGPPRGGTIALTDASLLAVTAVTRWIRRFQATASLHPRGPGLRGLVAHGHPSAERGSDRVASPSGHDAPCGEHRQGIEGRRWTGGARAIGLGVFMLMLLLPASAAWSGGLPSKTVPAASSAAGSGCIHVVQPGESLSRIATRHGTTRNALITVNYLQVRDTPRAGQRLELPGCPQSISSRAKLVWPVDGPVSSGFGRRGFWGWHRGVDIKAPPGTPIRAAAPGVVWFSGWQSSYGRVIKIAHPDGSRTVYAHNLKNLVGVGDRVDARTVIGRVGRTGRATAYHLHFEVRRQGLAQDPLPLLGRRAPAIALAARDDRG